MMISKKAVINTAFIFLFTKMIISPVSTGDYSVPIFQSVSYLCDLVILICTIIYLPFTQKKFQYIHIAFLLLLFTYCLATLIFTEPSIASVISYHLKVYLPFLFFAMIVSYFSMFPDEAILKSKQLILLSFLLLVIGVLMFPESVNRLEIWWPSYFGGIHTTSYMAMSIFFLSYSLYVANESTLKTLSVIGGVVLLSVCFGWGVRTITGAFLVFVLAIFITNVQLGKNKLISIALPLLVLFLLFFLLFFSGSEEFSHFTWLCCV
ncbi:hypothetical protein, partial [Vibrio echinoideorum]|uniref:hypothetical protein n=1 Tax=Vibrio echinoideorum TaxID=2100116 RepID=UPI00354F4E8A